MPAPTTAPATLLGAWLVAQREFLENVRTKGFWITIIALPIVLAIAAVIPSVISRASPNLEYAVLDDSGWLADAITERIELARTETLLGWLADPPTQQLSPELKGAAGLLRRSALQDTEASTLATAIHSNVLPAELATELSTADLARLRGATEQATVRFWREHLPDSPYARYVPRTVGASTPRARADLDQEIAREQLFAYFLLPTDPVASGAGAEYVSKNLTNVDLKQWYTRHAETVILERRAAAAGLAPGALEHLRSGFRFANATLTTSGRTATQAKDIVSQWAPVLFVYALWVSVFAAGQMLLTSTVEEKSNRLADVILSSVNARTLLIGKVIGVAMTGGSVLLVWGSTLGVGLVWAAASFLGEVDLSGLLAPLYWLSFAVYFVLGFALFATAIAGLGALTSSLREAQNLLFPIQMVMMVPLVTMIPIARDPSGALAEILTWIPPFTPFVMMNRAADPPTLATYLGTTTMLLVCVYLVWRWSERLFRIGLLGNGAKVQLKDIGPLLRSVD